MFVFMENFMSMSIIKCLEDGGIILCLMFIYKCHYLAFTWFSHEKVFFHHL